MRSFRRLVAALSNTSGVTSRPKTQVGVKLDDGDGEVAAPAIAGVDDTAYYFAVTPPHTLLAENWASPAIGIGGSPKPRFSWAINDTGHRDIQSAAYQVIVSKRNEVTWDSGKVAVIGSTRVVCGVPLAPDTRYTWRVRWWPVCAAETSGRQHESVEDPSDYSAPAILHMGLLTIQDWQGAVPIGTQKTAPLPPPPLPPPPPIPPAPPWPPTHTHLCGPGECRMISTTTLMGRLGYFSFVQTSDAVPAAGVTNVAGCVAVCLQTRTCLQTTWAPGRGNSSCMIYRNLTSGFANGGGATVAWIKLSGRFLQNDTARVWFERFKDNTSHLVSNCSAKHDTCGAEQKLCWPDFTNGLPIQQVPEATILALNRGANYSCGLLNWDPKHVPPPPPPAPPGLTVNPAELMRTTFNISGALQLIESAVIYTSGVGWVETYINGHATAPDERLNPGRTRLDIRQLYVAHDVTALLHEGTNVVGVLLGQGWQQMMPDGGGGQLHTPVGRVLLSIKTADGHAHVTSSESWMGSRDGPILRNNIYMGETYDARREMVNWSTAGFAIDSKKWICVRSVDEFRSTRYTLTWQPFPPIRALQLYTALSITPIKLSTETVYVFKFPQNAAGWSKLTLPTCPQGTIVRMYFSENVCGSSTRWSAGCTVGQFPGEGKAGSVDQRNLGGAQGQHNTYICKGAAAGMEEYEPHFMYTGHQYVELHGYPGTPSLGSLLQRVVHSDVESTALTPAGARTVPRLAAGHISFGSSSSHSSPPQKSEVADLNQISQMARWTLINTLHSVPEDCDQRNERWGWQADASVAAEANFYYHDVGSLYTTWLRSIRDVQTGPPIGCMVAIGSDGDTNVVDGKPSCSGAVGDMAPGPIPPQGKGWVGLPGDPSWMFAYPLVYSYVHRYLGDKRLARELYPGIKAFSEFLITFASKSKTGLVTWAKTGDWLEVRPRSSLFAFSHCAHSLTDSDVCV